MSLLENLRYGWYQHKSGSVLSWATLPDLYCELTPNTVISLISNKGAGAIALKIKAESLSFPTLVSD